MNNYCEDELRTLFGNRGFVLLRNDDWEDQRLFAFSQQAKE
jgi:hypothetical protein